MKSITEKLERVQLKDIQIPLIVTQEVLNKIKFLCKEIPKVEWSGILFYETEGSIKDAKNMKFILKDILPLHKGTAAYTEYSFDFKLIDHLEANPHLETCNIGHIHSHNTMGVFFSGTDWSELEDNAPNHNIYLSFIVNNFMDFCAKVCFVAESKSLSAKDEKGISYLFDPVEKDPKKLLVVYDCKIESPQEKLEVGEPFEKYVEGIIKESEERQVESVLQTKPKNSWDWERGTNTTQNLVEETLEEIEADFDGGIEDFAIYILNIENSSRVFHSVIDTLKYFKNRQVSGNVLAKAVLNFYPQYYANFWSAEPYVGEEFVKVTEKVIENLIEERDGCTLYYVEGMLNPVITGLKQMLVNFKKEA